MMKYKKSGHTELYRCRHHLRPESAYSEVLLLEDCVAVICHDSHLRKSWRQRVSFSLLSALIQTYYFNLDILWEMVARSITFTGEAVHLSTQHIVHFPIRKTSTGSDAYLISHGVKSIESGESWRVQFLSEFHFPFALEITVQKDSSVEKTYVYRMPLDYNMVGLFETHCLERYADSHEPLEMQDQLKQEPNYMLNMLMDELIYDEEDDRFMVHFVEAAMLEKYLYDSLNRNRKEDRTLQKNIQQGEDWEDGVQDSDEETGMLTARNLSPRHYRGINGSKRASPRSSPRASPRGSPRGSPKGSPKGSPHPSGKVSSLAADQDTKTDATAADSTVTTSGGTGGTAGVPRVVGSAAAAAGGGGGGKSAKKPFVYRPSGINKASRGRDDSPVATTAAVVGADSAGGGSVVAGSGANFKDISLKLVSNAPPVAGAIDSNDIAKQSNASPLVPKLHSAEAAAEVSLEENSVFHTEIIASELQSQVTAEMQRTPRQPPSSRIDQHGSASTSHADIDHLLGAADLLDTIAPPIGGSAAAAAAAAVTNADDGEEEEEEEEEEEGSKESSDGSRDDALSAGASDHDEEGGDDDEDDHGDEDDGDEDDDSRLCNDAPEPSNLHPLHETHEVESIASSSTTAASSSTCTTAASSAKKRNKSRPSPRKHISRSRSSTPSSSSSAAAHRHYHHPHHRGSAGAGVVASSPAVGRKKNRKQTKSPKRKMHVSSQQKSIIATAWNSMSQKQQQDERLKEQINAENEASAGDSNGVGTGFRKPALTIQIDGSDSSQSEEEEVEEEEEVDRKTFFLRTKTGKTKKEEEEDEEIDIDRLLAGGTALMSLWKSAAAARKPVGARLLPATATADTSSGTAVALDGEEEHKKDMYDDDEEEEKANEGGHLPPTAAAPGLGALGRLSSGRAAIFIKKESLPLSSQLQRARDPFMTKEGQDDLGATGGSKLSAEAYTAGAENEDEDDDEDECNEESAEGMRESQDEEDANLDPAEKEKLDLRRQFMKRFDAGHTEQEKVDDAYRCIDDIVKSNQDLIAKSRAESILQLFDPVRSKYAVEEISTSSSDATFLMVREALEVPPGVRSEMSRSIIVDMLQKGCRLSPYFSRCSNADFRALCDEAELLDIEAKDVKPGEPFAVRGEPIRFACVILRGQVKMTVYENDDGDEVPVSPRSYSEVKASRRASFLMMEKAKQKKHPDDISDKSSAGRGSLLWSDASNKMKAVSALSNLSGKDNSRKRENSANNDNNAGSSSRKQEVLGSGKNHMFSSSGKQAQPQDKEQNEPALEAELERGSKSLKKRTRVLKAGDCLGQFLLEGQYHWHCDLDIDTSSSVSLCCLSLTALDRYVGQQGAEVESAMVMFWKHWRLWQEIKKHNEDLIRLAAASNIVGTGAGAGTEKSRKNQPLAGAGAGVKAPSKQHRQGMNFQLQPMNLIGSARLRVYQPGTDIFTQEVPRHHLFLILRGCCQYRRVFPDSVVQAELMPASVPLGKSTLMCGDFSFMDGEDFLWLERMAELDHQIQGTNQESEMVREHRKKKYFRFDKHKNSLVALSRVEVAVVPIHEIAKSSKLLRRLIELATHHYHETFISNEDLVRKHYEEKKWTVDRKEVMKLIAMDKQTRALKEVWQQYPANNVSDDLYKARRPGANVTRIHYIADDLLDQNDDEYAYDEEQRATFDVFRKKESPASLRHDSTVTTPSKRMLFAKATSSATERAAAATAAAASSSSASTRNSSGTSASVSGTITPRGTAAVAGRQPSGMGGGINISKGAHGGKVSRRTISNNKSHTKNKDLLGSIAVSQAAAQRQAQEVAEAERYGDPLAHSPRREMMAKYMTLQATAQEEEHRAARGTHLLRRVSTIAVAMRRRGGGGSGSGSGDATGGGKAASSLPACIHEEDDEIEEDDDSSNDDASAQGSDAHTAVTASASPKPQQQHQQQQQQQQRIPHPPQQQQRPSSSNEASTTAACNRSGNSSNNSSGGSRGSEHRRLGPRTPQQTKTTAGGTPGITTTAAAAAAVVVGMGGQRPHSAAAAAAAGTSRRGVSSSSSSSSSSSAMTMMTMGTTNSRRPFTAGAASQHQQQRATGSAGSGRGTGATSSTVGTGGGGGGGGRGGGGGGDPTQWSRGRGAHQPARPQTAGAVESMTAPSMGIHRTVKASNNSSNNNCRPRTGGGTSSSGRSPRAVRVQQQQQQQQQQQTRSIAVAAAGGGGGLHHSSRRPGTAPTTSAGTGTGMSTGTGAGVSTSTTTTAASNAAADGTADGTKLSIDASHWGDQSRHKEQGGEQGEQEEGEWEEEDGVSSPALTAAVGAETDPTLKRKNVLVTHHIYNIHDMHAYRAAHSQTNERQRQQQKQRRSPHKVLASRSAKTAGSSRGATTSGTSGTSGTATTMTQQHAITGIPVHARVTGRVIAPFSAAEHHEHVLRDYHAARDNNSMDPDFYVQMYREKAQNDPRQFFLDEFVKKTHL